MAGKTLSRRASTTSNRSTFPDRWDRTHLAHDPVSGLESLLAELESKVATIEAARPTLTPSMASQDLLTLLNRSLNQMLSRTLLTGGTTILAALMLWLFGGEAIKGFAFIIMIGIVIGTYSSIYIASPFALFWEEWFGPGGRWSSSSRRPGRRSSPPPGGMPRPGSTGPRATRFGGRAGASAAPKFFTWGGCRGPVLAGLPEQSERVGGRVVQRRLRRP